MDVLEMAERLKDLRGDRSQEDVIRSLYANHGIELSRQTLASLEAGTTNDPRSRTVDALAREYGTTVEYILYGTRPARKKGA